METHPFDKRLLFITGKGGVGKTTISGALALAAAKLGKKVLLVDMGGGDALAALFGTKTIPQIPGEIYPLIWAVQVDPKMALDEYVHTFIKSRFIANRITQSRLFDYLAAGTPGLKEIITLGKIWLWERERPAEGGDWQYDLIIVDAPATGHGLSFLQAPQVITDMIGIGPIKEQTEEVLRLLRDRKRTQLHIVTLPEELPVNEAVQLYRAASDELHMVIGSIIINGLYRKSFTTRESTEIKRMLRTLRAGESSQGFEVPVLRSARIAIGRRTQQEFYVKRIQEKIKTHFIEVHYRFTESFGLSELDDIAEGLLRSVPA